MVKTVVANGDRALALTDHGNMSGSVQLYQECRKAGITPFPGTEIYFVKDRQDKNAKRFHLGILVLDAEGYRCLTRLSSRSHTRENFHHKPLLDWSDLAEWKDHGWTSGLALTTGCYFSLLVQTLVSDGPEAAKHVLQRFSSLFPHTFVELQNHKIDQTPLTEDEIAVALFDLAQELGLPVVISQDAHYCHPVDKPVHETLKRVVAYGPDTDDAVFPGDGFHLAEAQWIRAHHQDRHWSKAEEGWGHLMALNSIAIPGLDSYHYNIPKVADEPDSVLDLRCREALRLRNLPTPYTERLESELSIVKDTGMAGYLLLVAEVTDWCANRGVYTQARGSASGSILCWLLGITQCDPIRYSLRFERFISRDRTKPPDIDLDVEDSRRQELIDWLKTRFAVTQIGTYLKYGINDDEKTLEEDRGKGSLIVAFKSVAKKQGASKEYLESLKTINDIPDEWRQALLDLAEKGAYKAVGTHAGGLIITTTQDEMDDLIPKMLIVLKKTDGADSYRVVSQYPMDDVAELGLVKLDVLGLRTLSLLRRCGALLGKDVRDGLDWIPLDDTRTFTTIRNGATAGVFQLEGGTAQRGCKEIKVRSLKDIIVVQALYRPAVMRSGGKDTYIARREGRQHVPDYHPLIMRSVKETFGVIVFQEQVISILRDLGMDPDELTDFLKAVKASQKADMAKAEVTMANAAERVMTLCEDAGISSSDYSYIWDAIKGFSEYGFNRAHATAYGVTAYQCAYLKTHHPLEFATALLQSSEGTKKETMYVSAVRQMGISIRRPHVNISGMSYSIDRRARSVRKGLVSILGIGERTASELEAHAPFESVSDIISKCQPQRVNGGKKFHKDGSLNGHLLKLREAGALEGLDG